MSEKDTGFYYVDIFIEKYKLAIEVQGIYHYSFGKKNSSPATKLKRKTLEKLGYSVLDIVLDDYIRLKDKKAKDEFIKK